MINLDDLEILLRQIRKLSLREGIEIGRQQAFDEVKAERKAEERKKRKEAVRNSREQNDYCAKSTAMVLQFPVSEVKKYFKELDAEKESEELKAIKNDKKMMEIEREKIEKYLASIRQYNQT